MKVLIEYKKDAKDTVKVSVERLDLWDADVTLARVIYPVLKKYRALYDKDNATRGCPMEFAIDPTRPEGPDNKDRFEDWIACLDKMVYSFEWLAKNNGDWDGPAVQEYYKERERLLKPHKKELKKLVSGSLRRQRESELSRAAFEVFVKEAEIHRQKVQEGIDLFAKYFGALWT